MRREKFLLGFFAVLFVGLVAWRVRQYAAVQPLEMPAAVGDDEAEQLHLVAGGRYLQTDIELNGETVPARRYRGFQARHDTDPQPGDRLCPITRTKSNPACTWHVGGRAYEFCCPPCIDEFVRLAKEQPELILPPDAYVQAPDS